MFKKIFIYYIILPKLCKVNNFLHHNEFKGCKMAPLIFKLNKDMLFVKNAALLYPYNKVTGCLLFVCMCVCMFVPKDFANRWTDQILLNRVASHRFR